MALYYVHAVLAVTAIIVGCLAGWGGLTLITARRTHGKVRLPFGFHKRSHMGFGLVYLVLLGLTLTLGFVATAQNVGSSELAEVHEILGISLVTLVGFGALVGYGMSGAGRNRSILRPLHVLLNYGACLVLAVQAILGFALLSRIW